MERAASVASGIAAQPHTKVAGAAGALWRIEETGGRCVLVRNGREVEVPGADALEAVMAMGAETAVVAGVALGARLAALALSLSHPPLLEHPLIVLVRVGEVVNVAMVYRV